MQDFTVGQVPAAKDGELSSFHGCPFNRRLRSVVNGARTALGSAGLGTYAVTCPWARLNSWLKLASAPNSVNSLTDVPGTTMSLRLVSAGLCEKPAGSERRMGSWNG